MAKKILTSFLIVCAVVFAVIIVYQPRLEVVRMTPSGFAPSYLTVIKGQSVKFVSDGALFWPASDPHPNHTNFSEFDPKSPIKDGDSWTFKFSKSGFFEYHNHLEPSSRGAVKVIETNPVDYALIHIKDLYNKFFVKHDIKYAISLEEMCSKLREDRVKYIECWSETFTNITRDFGVTEAVKTLSLVNSSSGITLGDCHLIADQIGTDAYWQFSSGKKFEFTKDFALCDFGFFHHFMSEHVSHGQDFLGSETLCSSLDETLVDQCFFGLGNGLAYYFWGIYPTSSDLIVSKGLGVCKKLQTNGRTCALGVYSGIDHLFEGKHGSELVVDIKDPFSFCRMQPDRDLAISCYERMIPSISHVLGKESSQNAKVLISWVYKMPYFARQASMRRLGIMLSEEESVKVNPIPNKALDICRNQAGVYSGECEWGVFYNVFLNGASATSEFYGKDCESFGSLKDEEKTRCQDAYDSTVDFRK